MKSIPISILVCILLFFVLLYPVEGLNAAQNGLNLWLHTLLPTLLPFIIFTNILLYSGSVEKIIAHLHSHFPQMRHNYFVYLYITFVGFLCGYPMGAKTTTDFYQNQKISQSCASTLLTFVNNPSPAFLSSYVCIQCLNRRSLILPAFLIIYASNICSAILVFFFQKRFYIQGTPDMQKEKSTSHKSEKGIDFSIMNGFETMTRLGGYILIFSILSAFIQHYWMGSTIGKPILLCLTEISTGLMYLKSIPLSPSLTCAIALSATSFGGFCIAGQTYSVLHKQLPIAPYFVSKILSCGLTFCFSLFFIH